MTAVQFYYDSGGHYRGYSIGLGTRLWRAFLALLGGLLLFFWPVGVWHGWLGWILEVAWLAFLVAMLARGAARRPNPPARPQEGPGPRDWAPGP